jgi:hypothetical protein
MAKSREVRKPAQNRATSSFDRGTINPELGPGRTLDVNALPEIDPVWWTGPGLAHHFSGNATYQEP